MMASGNDITILRNSSKQKTVYETCQTLFSNLQLQYEKYLCKDGPVINYIHLLCYTYLFCGKCNVLYIL